ncbi:1888_t:CDS:1 [Scutellospora calospora]|uniref:1888_t:CDS:1 n=1 Tax=Scutellospora calospora TaxID=85575 RepID=A0ACA9KXA6_9GLOM|nr:1888_t:CDS:1 [Scutellospora calospora]
MSIVKNRPQAGEYIKSVKGVSFAYPTGSNTFQKGTLGDTDSYVTGNLIFNYGKPQQIRSVCINLKGAEKTTWYKAQARSKAVYAGEHTVVDLLEEVWRSDHSDAGVMNLDIPFKIKLPNNLPDTINTEIGSVEYIIRAIINRKGSLVSNTVQVAEIKCPLKRTLVLSNTDNVPSKLRGEARCGIDYLFSLPPKKNFNPGAYVSIPMRIRFLKPGVSVERIEINLKTCMDFRCSLPSETRHIKEKATSLLIPRQELKYSNPSSSDQFEGECLHTINLFIPRTVQPTYSGRYISINHQLCIKFCLWGADNDFVLEESVRVTNIFDQQTSNGQSSSHSNMSPTYQRSKSDDDIDVKEIYSDAYVSEEYDHSINGGNGVNGGGIGTALYLNPSDQVEKGSVLSEHSNPSSHSSHPSQNSLKIITDMESQQAYHKMPPNSTNEELVHTKVPYHLQSKSEEFVHYHTQSKNEEFVHSKVPYQAQSNDELSKVYRSATNDIIHNYNDELYEQQHYSYGYGDEDDMNSSLSNELLLQQQMQRLALAHHQQQQQIFYSQQNPIYVAPNSPPVRLNPLPALPNMKKSGVILSPSPRMATGNMAMNLNGSYKFPPPYAAPPYAPPYAPSERGRPVNYNIDERQMKSQQQAHLMVDKQNPRRQRSPTRQVTSPTYELDDRFH